MRLLALIGLPAVAVLGLAAWNPAAVTTAPAPQPAAGGAYQVDAAHSSVVFRVKHAGASWFYGRFNEFSGAINHDPENPGASTVEVTIQAGSVDSNSEQRDTHIKSPDFLSAKEFPTITFKSTSVKAAGDNLEIVGDLTFRGVTKSVTAAVEHVGEGEFRGKRSGFEAVLDIKRTEFGSDYGVAQGVLSDEVRLIIALEGVQQ